MYFWKSWTKEALSFLPMKIALSPSMEAAVASSLARYIRTLSGSLLKSFGILCVVPEDRLVSHPEHLRLGELEPVQR